MIRTAILRRLAGFDKVMQEVAGKAALSFALRLGGAMAQFGFIILITRFFGPTGLGGYALSMSVVVIAATLGRWGLDQATLKYVAIHAARGERMAAGRVVVKASLVVTGLSLSVSVLLLVAAPWLSLWLFHSPEITTLLRILALSIVPFNLLNLLAEALRGLRRIGAHTLVQGGLVPMLSIPLLLLFHYSADIGLDGAALAYFVSCLLAMAGGFLLWRLYLGQYPAVEGAVAGACARTLLVTAGPMAWVALIGVASSFIETLLLGVFRTGEEVGLYAAAQRLALLINFVIIAFNSILAPKFAALYHAGDLTVIRDMARRTVWLMLLVTTPVFALFFLLPHLVLSLFGSQFGDAAAVLVILAFGQLIVIVTGPVEIMLMMTGHERLMRGNLVISTTCSLVCGVLLVYRFGIIGAAASVVIRSALLNGLSIWDVRRELFVPAAPAEP